MKHVQLHAKGGKLPMYEEYQWTCKYKIKQKDGSRYGTKVRCNRKFTEEDKLIVHESVKHTNDAIKVYCQVCGMSFASIASKSAHVARHSDEKDKNRDKYICEYEGCTRSIKTGTALQMHHKSHKSKGDKKKRGFRNKHYEYRTTSEDDDENKNE